ncbi:MAG: 4'-phosphopantetheinyl transferase superfamily protein [Cyclobacteriaceae bacterium]|nr:4'-phosphopantetheinyl transferase superfamily protein [Cyclobacteriaceae bacterium]
MPLIDLNGVNTGKIALWHITEDESFLADQMKSVSCPEEIINPQKRVEWLSGRLLIRYLVDSIGLTYHGIEKDRFGKPFLKSLDHHISLSHSYPYVAAQIHPSHSVGIDIEQPKEKLLRVAPRILNAVELENAGSDITKHCIYWSAKEALYKIYGKRGLLFTNNLSIEPFDLKETGYLKGWIQTEGNNVLAELQYIVHKDYVLVYSKTD